MNLSRYAPLKLAAVLVMAGGLLGCEGPTKATGQAPPVYPAVTVHQPELVTVTNVGPTNATPVAEASQPSAGETIPAQPAELTPALQEVVKLAQSGVADEVILAFIQNSPNPFNPTPEQILYLTDIGLSDAIITALVNHRGTQPVAAQAAQPGVVPAPAPAAAPEATYNPEPQVVYSSPPVVQYVTPAPVVVEYDYFYSSLAPYGVWVDLPIYGRCWQPSVAIRYSHWQPYCDRGRWLYSDHGWYWHSDYSWGWAPFHYGRWFRHPARGWCWTPGSVWAPAWVSWRYTDAYCGWAPLPPGAHLRAGGFTYYGASVGVSFGFGLHSDAWTFVPSRRFHDREVWRHRVAHHEHGKVFSRSRVVNNYIVHNNTIINKGVSDRVPGLERSEPRKVVVRDLPNRGGGTSGGIRPDRVRQEGSDLVVYRPQPLAPRQPEARTPAPDRGHMIPSQPGGSGRPNPGTISGPSREGTRPAGTGPRSEPAPPAVAGPRPGGAGDGGRSGTAGLATVPPQASSGTRPTIGTPVPSRPAAPPSAGTDESAVRPSGPTFAVPSSSSRPQPQTWSPAPATQSTPPTAAQPAPRVNPAPRQEPVKPDAARVTPGTPVAAPQTYSVPRPASQATAPSAVRRMETPKPLTTVAPERYQVQAPAAVSASPSVDDTPTFRSSPQPSSFPAPQSRPSFESRPTRSYSAPAIQPRPSSTYTPPTSPARTYTPPVQSQRPTSFTPVPSRPTYSAPAVQPRPAPSYAPPAVQSRPAPSYTPPAVQSRPAPSYTPSAVQSRPTPGTSFSPPPRPAPQAVPSSRPATRSGDGRD